MSDSLVFIDGLMFKPPVKKDGSPLPHFIKAKGSIKLAELIAFLNEQEGEWINFDVKESKNGKWYASVDNWEPTKDQQYAEGMHQAKQAAQPVDNTIADEDIPF